MKASESLRAQAWVVVTVFVTLRALMKPVIQPPRSAVWDLPRGRSQTALLGGWMTGFINARSVTKTVTTTQAWARRDSDAFILPDYTSSSPARSHQVHTSGTKRALRSVGSSPFLFRLQAGRVAGLRPAFYFIFFLFGGVTSQGGVMCLRKGHLDPA